MKNVAHYQSESQTMNTTTCLILITATLLAAAKGFEVGSFDNLFYYKVPAPTSKVILVNCKNGTPLEQLDINSAEAKSKQHWFLQLTIPNSAGCNAKESNIPVDRSMYRWSPLTLPIEMSMKGQEFIVITPSKFEEGAILWVGSQ